MKHAALLGPLLLGSSLVAVSALAQAGAAPSVAPAVSTATPQASAEPPTSNSGTVPATERSSATCVERLPEGKSRPELEERFPSRGLAGHAAWLEVDVEHERAEIVMPGGLALALENAESAQLQRAGFMLPDPAGGAKPRLVRELKGDKNLTRLAIPVVPLPKTPGRHQLELPPLPITIARASGDVITLCTQPHALVVDEPIANEPNPKPKHNPPPQRQLELWEAARQATLIALVTLAIAAFLAVVLFKLGLLRRLKRLLWHAKPAPPPRPPWETALEELFDIRNAGLIHAGRYAEHYDRVSDTVRKYLGERYDFDGLESTTREVLQRLCRVAPGLPVLGEVEKFLRDADLVKFARLTPTEHQCEHALTEAEHIVTSTRPDPALTPAQVPTEPGETDESARADAPGKTDESASPYAPRAVNASSTTAESASPYAPSEVDAPREIDAPRATDPSRSEEEKR